MESAHLTDEILQDYIFTKVLDGNAAKHIANCNHCMAQLEAYQVLFSSLKTLPEEIFSFDTTSLVMQKIETQRKKQKIALYLFYALLPGVVLLPIYYILPMLAAVFNIQSINSASMFLLITGALGIVLFLVIDMFRTQKEKEMQFSL